MKQGISHSAMFDYNQLTPEIPGGILTSGCLNENQKVHPAKEASNKSRFHGVIIFRFPEF
jgi:hypothetical protein